MNAARMDTDMSAWGPGVVHYRADDGRNFAVSVDAGITAETAAAISETLAAAGEPTLPDGPHRIYIQPTVIIACNDIGEATNLDRLHEFPPGTTHEDALSQAGYDIGEPGNAFA